MRVTFMVGSRNWKDTRYRVLHVPRRHPFPGPWRLEAVVREDYKKAVEEVQEPPLGAPGSPIVGGDPKA